MRIGLLLVVLLTPLGSLLAQDPLRDHDAQLQPTIEKLLASERAADVAWGGYLAHRYRLRPVARALGVALERWSEQPDIEARMVRLHLLDGLLGAEVPMPAEKIEPLLLDALTRPAALALIAREPRGNAEALLRIALQPAPQRDIARRAAARLIVVNDLHLEALTVHVLENLRTTLVVSVRDATAKAHAEVGIRFGGGVANPELTRTQPGFPPLVKLELVAAVRDKHIERAVVPSFGGEDALLLARSERVTYRPEELELRGKTETFDDPELLLLLREMSQVKVESRTSVEHQFRDTESFLTEVGARRDEVRSVLDRAVASLRKRGWLGKDVLPDFHIPLEIEISDQRGDQTTALPELPPPPPQPDR